MSYNPYLTSVTAAPMKRVYPSVGNVRTRDTLEACIRALAGMAVALAWMRAH
jgi:hypothetical protein